jgi:hypothetical protein
MEGMHMIITTKIKLDLQKAENIPAVNAVQTDACTRRLEIELLSNGKSFQIPADSHVIIRFRKADGKGGEYDTLPDGTSAWNAVGNQLNILLAPQVLTFPGHTMLTVALIRNESCLNTFIIPINVAPAAIAPASVSENYFNAAQWIRSIVAEEVEGNAMIPTLTVGTVQTLAPDANATASITGTVKNPVLNLGIPGPYPRPNDTEQTVPEHWSRPLENGVQAINRALCAAGANKSAFLFYSDAHWNYGAQMAPALLKFLHRHTGINKTIFGGDIVNNEGSDYDTMEYLWDWRRQLKDLPNHHSVVGNHDDGNETNHLFSKEYVYGYLLAAEETPDIVRGDGLYYYIDSPAERSRYLYLDTGYLDGYSLSDAQEAFIRGALRSTPAGWHIVVVAHIWYQLDYSQYNQRPVPVQGLSGTAASVAAILDDYNSRVGEFSACGGWVEFCIGGHIHYDYNGQTATGIPIILVETDSRHTRGNYTYTAQTLSEASVNGIIADYNTKTVHVVRVGRGQSRDVPIVSTIVSYTNVLTTAVSPDGTLYNEGKGYQQGYTLNAMDGTEVASSGHCCTGYIAAKPGDVIRFKNITFQPGYDIYCVRYRSTFAFHSGSGFDTEEKMSAWNPVFDSNGNVVELTIPASISASCVYFRFAVQHIDVNSVITVNESLNP